MRLRTATLLILLAGCDVEPPALEQLPLQASDASIDEAEGVDAGLDAGPITGNKGSAAPAYPPSVPGLWATNTTSATSSERAPPTSPLADSILTYKRDAGTAPPPRNHEDDYHSGDDACSDCADSCAGACVDSCSSEPVDDSDSCSGDDESWEDDDESWEYDGTEAGSSCEGSDGYSEDASPEACSSPSEDGAESCSSSGDEMDSAGCQVARHRRRPSSGRAASTQLWLMAPLAFLLLRRRS